MLLGERYRTTEVLAHGGMGEVYRGCDELLGRPVAVKLLRPDLHDPFAAARFQREARAAAMVKHPHVVAVYDFGHSNGEYYLVMELVEGRSIAHEVALHGPLAPERSLEIVRQAASGLAAAHQRGIVHRDIKPDNLLLEADGQVKVADFGIARSPVDATDPALESSGRILGTSHYLAPERALGRSATTASDVYSLGCVLYQLLTGHPPFTGDDPTAILSQHVEVAPVIPPELPAPVAELLRRMLAKDPEARPTAIEIATTTADLRTDAPTAELPTTHRHRWRRLFAVLAMLLLTGTVVTAGVLTDQETKLPPVPTDITPSQPPRSVPPRTPTTAPPATKTATTRVTVTTSPRGPRSTAAHPSHGKAKKPKKAGKSR